MPTPLRPRDAVASLCMDRAEPALGMTSTTSALGHSPVVARTAPPPAALSPRRECDLVCGSIRSGRVSAAPWRLGSLLSHVRRRCVADERHLTTHDCADCFQITLLHLLYLIPSSSPRNRHARTYRSITSESQRSERFTQHRIRQDASGTTRCSKHAPALLYGNAFTARSLNTLQWGPVQRKDVNKRWPRGVKKTEEGDDARYYPCALGLRLPLVLDEAGEVGGRVRVHELYEGIGRA